MAMANHSIEGDVHDFNAHKFANHARLTHARVKVRAFSLKSV